jgi:hypothetical protein
LQHSPSLSAAADATPIPGKKRCDVEATYLAATASKMDVIPDLGGPFYRSSSRFSFSDASKE